MSFDTDSDAGKAMIGECKRDYEKEAAIAKERLDRAVVLKNLLMEFIEKDGMYDFRNISSLAEFIGALEIVSSKHARSYSELIVLIEKNQ